MGILKTTREEQLKGQRRQDSSHKPLMEFLVSLLLLHFCPAHEVTHHELCVSESELNHTFCDAHDEFCFLRIICDLLYRKKISRIHVQRNDVSPHYSGLNVSIRD